MRERTRVLLAVILVLRLVLFTQPIDAKSKPKGKGHPKASTGGAPGPRLNTRLDNDYTLDGQSVTIFDHNATLRVEHGQVLYFVLNNGGAIDSVLNGQVPCPNNTARKFFVKGDVKGTRIVGTMQRCTTQELVDKCSLDPVWEPNMVIDSVSDEQLSGTYHTEWWKGNGNRTGCPYTRDPGGDHDVAFTMTRTTPPTTTLPGGSSPCPDTGKVGAVKGAVDNFATVNNFLANAANATGKPNPELAQAFKSLGDGMGGASKVLGDISNFGQECAKFKALLDTVLSAINEVNSAGCHSDALAKGFDHLFKATGDMGLYVSDYVPQFRPLFTILSTDQNFFQTVGGQLGTTVGADQFAFVDGYTTDSCGR